MTSIEPQRSTTTAGASADSSNEATTNVIASTDAGAEVAILTVQAGLNERHTARATRDAQERIAAQEYDAEVQSMHDAASSMRTQAWFDGGMTLATQAAGGPSTTLGTLLSAGQKVGDGLLAADQQDDNADAKAHEAAATHAQTSTRDAADSMSDANDLIRSAVQFYGGYVETRAQTLSIALHRA
jgi:hypothetical protein